MSKILQALERKNQPGAVDPDQVMAGFVESLGKAKLAGDVYEAQISDLCAQVITLTEQRDTLLNAAATRDMDAERESIELGELRERCQTMDAACTRMTAELALERSSIDLVTGDSDESIRLLQTELSTERLKSASLAGELSAVKSIPAPVQQAMPVPVDYSGMEFSVGNIVRGPDGIQNAQIKLVRAN